MNCICLHIHEDPTLMCTCLIDYKKLINMNAFLLYFKLLVQYVEQKSNILLILYITKTWLSWKKLTQGREFFHLVGAWGWGIWLWLPRKCQIPLGLPTPPTLNIDSSITQTRKDVLKMKYFSIYFMLVTFMSHVKFSNIVFPVWFEVLLQNNFGQSLPLKILEIRLLYRK